MLPYSLSSQGKINCFINIFYEFKKKCLFVKNVQTNYTNITTNYSNWSQYNYNINMTAKGVGIHVHALIRFIDMIVLKIIENVEIYT